MKKLILLLLSSVLMCATLYAQTKSWNGTVSTDWNDGGNWTPAGVPTSTDDVSILIGTIDPVIFSGTAVAKSININASGALLTVNVGATLTVSTNDGIALQLFRGIFSNNGTTTLTNTNPSEQTNNFGVATSNNSTLNNAGNITIVGGSNIAIQLNPGTFNNLSNATATVSGKEIIRTGGSSGFYNEVGATFIGTGTSTGMVMNPGVLTNSGTMEINGQIELYTSSSPFTNNNCGKIRVAGKVFFQIGVSATNHGLLEILDNLNVNGTFTNNGVLFALNYPTYTNRRVQINNNAPYNGIFTISTAAGASTIDGIFTDQAALNSAGTFNQTTNIFVPSPTLPLGSQTLYAKITLSGVSASCPYVVPFTYNYILPPAFTTQPTNAGECLSTSASFSVAATGATSYQWQVSTDGGSSWANLSNFSPYSNVTTTTLTISTIFLSFNNYQYRCVATGPGGITNSNAAILVVNPPTRPSTSGTITWTGAINTDWNTPCNWSPASVPTAANDVVIPNVSKDPIIGNGTIASTGYLTLNSSSNLVVNAGASLIVRGNSGGTDGMLFNNATFTNNGTTEIQLAGGQPLSVSGVYVSNSGSSIINNGTLTINATQYAFSTVASFTINNNANGILNVTTGNLGDGFFDNSSRIVLVNAGIINSNCPKNDGFQSITNSGTFNINGNFTIKTSKDVANQACGKFIISGNYDNLGFSSNAGYVYVGGNLFRSGGFNNNAVLKYTTLSGSSITNINAASVIVRNTPIPIFQFNLTNTYNGTINGIFTDTAATISAGTFTAPNTFVPSISLPTTLQTLYAKITPSGGACEYVVPFTYLVLPVFLTQPVNTSVCGSLPTSFSVAANFADTYQWQISTNSGGSWSNLVVSSIYPDVTSPTLNITDATGLNGRQYRCIATGTNGTTNSNAGTLTVIIPTSTPTGIITWTGVVNTDWSIPCNWNPSSVPGTGNDVIIPNTTNKPTITAGVIASAKSVEVRASSSLTIASTGSLTVNGSITVASIVASFHNLGTFTNNGTLTIGTTATSGAYSFVNKSILNNNTGAEINVGNATSGGIYNHTGTFVNTGKVNVGLTNSIVGHGIFNDATFNNNAGGEIKIENVSSSGIFNRTGTFVNISKINIGLASSIGGNGILNDVTFNNNAGGEIKIENVSSSGIFNRSGTFNNNAKIVTGASTTMSGFLNDATFNNNATGEMLIGNAYNRGNTFNNFGLLSIQHSSGSLLNGAIFNNKPCGKVIVSIGNLTNSGSGVNYLNEGLTQVKNTLSNSAIFTNNGTLTYGSLTGTISNATNPSIIINNNANILNIFSYGGTYDGMIDGIFTDTMATISAGTFTSPNTFIPSGLLTLGANTLYAKVTPNGASCSYTVPFIFILAPPAFTTQPTNKNVCIDAITSLNVVTTNATSVQWQVSTNGGMTFNNITASALYSNPTTNVLSISNTTGLNGFQYRCIATGPAGTTTSNVATLTILSQCIVISIVSGDWESPSTWDAGRVPTAVDNVIIDTGHTVSLSTLATIKNLTQRGTLILTAASAVKNEDNIK